MRLSDVLSKPPGKEYVQIDAFLQNKAGKVGQKVDISTGTVALNYFCVSCGDIRTFWSSPKLTCIFVSKNLISVDCVLTCGCGASIPAWFLIESKNDITGQAPAIRILKKSVKLSDMVRINCSGAQLMSKMAHNSCQSIFMHINRNSPEKFSGL